MVKKLKSFLFENATLSQTVFKNTFWLGFGQLVSRLIRAVLIIYAARVLGAGGYGVFSYALSFAGFFTIFSDIGLTPFLTRESVRNEALRIPYISTAFAVKLALIAVSSLIIVVTLPYTTRIPESAPLFPILMFLFAFDSIRDFSFAISRSFQKMELEAGINIFTNAAILGFGAAALIASPSPLTLMVAYTAGTGLGMVAVLFRLREFFRRFWEHVDRSLLKPILLQAWPFGVMGLLSTIMLNTDTVMIGWLRSAEEVGFYSAAQRIVLLLYLIPGFLSVSTFPAMARLATTDLERFRGVLHRVLHATLVLALPLVVGGALLAGPLIHLTFGAEYVATAPALQVLLLTLLFVFPGSVVNNAIFALNRQKLLLAAFAVGGLGNVLLNYFLIPLYGIQGASWATVTTQFLSNALTIYMLHRLQPLRVPRGLPKAVLAAALMGGAVWGGAALGIHAVVLVLAGAAVYFAVLHLTREPLFRYALGRLREHFV